MIRMAWFEGRTARMPSMLHRPFRSVGELGYAFRDLPFKSLDFFTAESADAGLLDLFSVDDSAVMAGRINLNTRNPEVVKAVINGGLKKEQDTTLLLNTDVNAIAAALVQRTSNSTDPTKGPLLNRAELVTKFSDDLGGALSANPDKGNKTQREATVRALADVANTRTWNLLIDIVAQTGRYSSSSNDLSKFIVEGESRYWLHLAIDRYTGEIIERKLEPVHE